MELYGIWSLAMWGPLFFLRPGLQLAHSSGFACFYKQSEDFGRGLYWGWEEAGQYRTEREEAE